MINEFHIESIKEELASYEMKVRQLSIYCNNAIDLLSEVDAAFLHNNDRYSNKVQNFIKQKPETSLSEYEAQVIERLIYDPKSPDLAQSNIKEALQAYANARRCLG